SWCAARPTTTSCDSTQTENARGGATSLPSVENGVVRVGLLGCGNVGAALVELIGAHSSEIARRSGLQLEVARVAVRNLAKERPVELADGVLTDDAQSVVDDPRI